MLILAVPQMFPGQPVMFDVIDQFQLPDRDKGLPQEQGQTGPSTQQQRQQQHPALQGPVAEEGIGQIRPGQIAPRQHVTFRLEGRCQRLPQDTREKPVKPLVIPRGHRVARRADMAVMHQQMFRPEMRIEHHRQQQIGQVALDLVLLMHQLVAVIDPDCAGDHPHAKEQHDLLKARQMLRMAHIPDQAEQRDELHGRPDQGDRAIPCQLCRICLGVGVFGIKTKQRVKQRKEIPGDKRQQDDGPPPLHRAQPGHRNQQKREPERQRAGDAGQVIGRDELGHLAGLSKGSRVT